MSVPFSVSGVAPIRRFVCLFLFFIAFFTDFYSATGFWPCRRFLWKEKTAGSVLFFFPLPVSYGSFPDIPLLHPSGVRTDLQLLSGTSCFSGSRLLYGRHFPGFLYLPVRFLPFCLFPVSGLGAACGSWVCFGFSASFMQVWPVSAVHIRSIWNFPSGSFVPPAVLLVCPGGSAAVCAGVLGSLSADFADCSFFSAVWAPFKTPVSAAKTGR